MEIDYEKILEQGEVFVPERVRDEERLKKGEVGFCVYVPMRAQGWVYKFTMDKKGQLSRGELGRDVVNVHGSTHDSWDIRMSAWKTAYGAWKRWQEWKRSLPTKQPQPVTSRRGQPIPPYRRPYHDSDDDNNNTT